MKAWIFKGEDGHFHFHCGEFEHPLTHWIDAKELEVTNTQLTRWAQAWVSFCESQKEMAEVHKSC